MKKKVSRGVKRRLLIFGPISVIIIIYTLISIGSNMYSIIELRRQKSELQNEIVALEEKQEQLEIELGKLQDPDYIARFARENFLYSKEGEYIIRIDRDDVQEQTILNEVSRFNKALAVTTFSLLILSSVYIKNRKKKNKKKK